MPWEGDKATKSSFTNTDKALLTVMLQCETPETAIGRIRNALCEGSEAFCLQAEEAQDILYKGQNIGKVVLTVE